jgi:hypothetical protein
MAAAILDKSRFPLTVHIRKIFKTQINTSKKKKTVPMPISVISNACPIISHSFFDDFKNLFFILQVFLQIFIFYPTKYVINTSHKKNIFTIKNNALNKNH